MYEVTRAPNETRKVRISIYRGTGRERIEVFATETKRYAELPPEIEEELTSEKPRLVAFEVPHERTEKLPPKPRALRGGVEPPRVEGPSALATEVESGTTASEDLAAAQYDDKDL